MKILCQHAQLKFLIFFLALFFLIAAYPQLTMAQALTDAPITSPKCNQFTFDASGSSDPDNREISYFWDFGDGNTSTEPVVSHAYAESGDYTVTLSVTDDSGLECGTDITTQKVRVNIPPFATFTSKEMVCNGESIVMDASGSYDDISKNLSYHWDFGDGTKSSENSIVNKTYARGGKYTVALTVDDNSNTVCSKQTFEKEIYVNEPPIADAGENILYKCVSDAEDMVVSFDGSASNDPNGDPLSFTWDFGDGKRAEGPKVKHRYTSLGNYDAKLIVKDNTNIGCSTSVDFISVKLNKSPLADAGPDIMACVQETVNFDGSSSYAEHKKGTLLFDWSFGDGEAAKGVKSSHQYSKPGTYKVNLTVHNELNPMCAPAVDTKIVTVNSSPTASLKTISSTCLGTQVDFDASASTDMDGDALEYYWSFGDGTILKSGPKVSHQYKQGGNYRVTVIVDDANGTACSTATATADIKINTPPVADAGTNTACCVNLDAKFDASASSDADGDPLTYTWDFGDGTKVNGVIVNHRYPKSGAYSVTLTVDDNSGTTCSSATAGFIADINAPPTAVMTIK